MMIRKQISVTPEQESTLKREAERRGISEAAIIRELVDELRARSRDAAWADASKAIGSYRSGFTDIAENHDFYLHGPDIRDEQ